MAGSCLCCLREIWINMYVFTYVWVYVLVKRKLTLSVDGELLREVKSLLAGEGESVSGVVEEFFESLLGFRWLDGLAEELGLGRLEPLDPSEVPRRRPAGLDAGRLVRELRDGRL